jgi:hypothetical protein
MAATTLGSAAACFWAPLADAGWREPLDGHTVTASDEAARELLRPEDRAGSLVPWRNAVVAPDATATVARRAGFGGAPLPVRCRRVRVDAAVAELSAIPADSSAGPAVRGRRPLRLPSA